MRLVDTHCHLDFPDYKDDLGDVIRRAESEGVVRFIAPGTNIASSRRAVELSAKYGSVFAALGIHPHEADKADSSSISALRQLVINSDKVVAVGEIGLDKYKLYSAFENQTVLLRRCLDIARELDLPVILHNRDAGKEVLSILRDMKTFVPEGVVHCFSSGRDTLKEFLELGMHVSFTGNITFNKAAELRDTVKHVPLDRLLLETDSPFIAPVPLRGKRNEPAFLKHILGVYAKVYGLSAEDIARITTHNANRLFRLGLEEKGAVAYPIRDSLYLNITNRCTNRCSFCTRRRSDYVMGHNLKLDGEPDRDEVICAMGEVSGYKEVVFCGYGEPTLRFEALKQIASWVKSRGGKVRLVTNGEGNLINSRDVCPELKGLVDRVSVSLNAPGPERYNELCAPVFGKDTFGGITAFIKGCKAGGIAAEITCLDVLSADEIEECRRMAGRLGVSFRLRHMDAVG